MIDYHGKLVYWFEKALNNIRNEFTIAIAATHHIKESYLRNHKNLFAQDLSTLPYAEWNGLMRVYAQNMGIQLTPEDREYFKNILNGYPPQVLFCVDEIRDKSLEMTKRNSHELVDKFSQKATEILNAAISVELSSVGYGFP